MAAKQQQMAGETFTSHIAGMSKNQLYEIMSQMKTLIEQNQQQARQILIDNPTLTKALFQAQIMLGMVQPPQVMPDIQQVLSQPPQQTVPPVQQPNVQASQSFSNQSGLQGQSSSSQPQIPFRQQQTSISMSPSVPPLSFQSETMPSYPMQLAPQVKTLLSAEVPSISLPQPSQIHNLPLPPPPVPQFSVIQSHVPTVSSQMQKSLQTGGVLQQPLQPPLPQQLRPPSMQPFSHQLHPQMPPSLGFQPSNTHQQMLSQPMFHSGVNPPSSFPQAQQQQPSRPLSQQLYQGSSHMLSDFGNQSGTSMQVDKGAHWAHGLPDMATTGTQFPGLPPMNPGPGGQQPRPPPPLTPEMEKTLLQQVMSLTPEQINLLPLEQRHQVLQLQQLFQQWQM